MFLWLTVIYLLWASFGLYWKGWGLQASRHILNSTHGSTSGPGFWLRAHPIVLWKLLQFVGIDCDSAGLAGGLRTQSVVSPPSLHFPPKPTSQMAGKEAGWAWRRTRAVPGGTAPQGDLKRGCYCFSLLEQNRAARAQVASSQSSSIRNLTDYMYYRLRTNYIPNINIIQL